MANSIPQEEACSQALSPMVQITNTVLSFLNAMALKCAVELGIPQAMHKHGQPITLSHLVSVLSLPPSKAPCLARLMRALKHSGFFAKHAVEGGEEAYALTPLSRYLSQHASPLVRGILQPALIAPSFHLSSWIRGVDTPTAFHIANGMSIWEYAGENPEFNGLFNAAMTDYSAPVAREIVENGSMVFDGLCSLVDVGGGNGGVAIAIAEAFPHVKCTVYELPHVVDAQPPHEMVEFVAGNMFDCVPPADAVILKWVLHGYDDEDCLKILRKCKEAISSKGKGGKVIIAEMVLNFITDDHFKTIETQFLSDLQMMMVVGGKERDEQEWEKIFFQAGFTSYKITPLDFMCLIEVYP